MRLALPIFIALLLAPASAHAATVRLVPDPRFGDDEDSIADLLVYTAAPGEQNALTAQLDTGGASWTLTDPGAIVVAQAPCVSLDPHTARCAAASDRFISRIDADLGDLADRFSSSSVADGEPNGVVGARGGAGDDVLESNDAVAVLRGDDGDDLLRVTGAGEEGGFLNGGPGDDELRGGPELDELNGGGGRDELYGGGDEDILADGDGDDPGPDLFDGGSGGCCLTLPGDRVSYRGRTRPVRVDLADDEPEGEAGEGDVFVGIESAEGGSAADRLRGDGRQNTLIGRPGRDLLAGRGGNDALVPGIGGGPVACGAGRDRAGPTNAQDRLAPDCEVLDASDAGIFALPVHPARPAPGRLVYRVTCPEDVGTAACSGALHLREARGAQRLLGVGSFPRGRWERRRFDVALTPLGRRLVGRRVLTTMRLGIRTRGPRTQTVRWTITLRL